MKWADRITALVLIVIAGAWIYLAIQLPFPAFARVSKMSPGSYPIAVATLLAVLAILLLIQTFQTQKSAEKKDDDVDSRPRNLKAVQHLITGGFLFLGYVVLIPFIGFVVDSFLFVFFILKFIGRYKLFITLPIAVGIPSLLWAIFAYLLTVPLPKGPWGF